MGLTLRIFGHVGGLIGVCGINAGCIGVIVVEDDIGGGSLSIPLVNGAGQDDFLPAIIPSRAGAGGGQFVRHVLVKRKVFFLILVSRLIWCSRSGLRIARTNHTNQKTYDYTSHRRMIYPSNLTIEVDRLVTSLA